MQALLLSGLAATMSLATAANAATSAKYLHLVNRAHDSLASLAIAESGSRSTREIDLGRPLQGGGASTTLLLETSGCRIDLYIGFVDGRHIAYRDVDVCRHSVLRVQRLPTRSPETSGPEPGRKGDILADRGTHDGSASRVPLK
jgi:hypothetical protein